MKQIYYLLIGCFFTFNCIGQTKNPPKYRITKNNLKELLINKQASYTHLAGVDTTKQESLINFNPIILDYSKSRSLKIKYDIEELSNSTFFTVYISDIATPEQELWSVKTANSRVELTNLNVVNDKETIPYDGGKLESPTLNSYIKTYSSKNKANNATSFIEFGGFSGKNNKASKGVLAELVIYNMVLRSKAKQAVESSLALKYGITLTNAKDYLSSDKKILFKVEDAPTYANRIAGIGKDDSIELNQKQSHSTQNGDGIVTIGAGEIAKSNQENKSIIENQNFLVWGDNNSTLTERPATDNTSLPLLQRQWLLQATGDKASELATTVQFDAFSIFKEQNLDIKRYLLVIDTSGKGTFLPENLKYVPAAKFENNTITFNNVKWDTDKSGNDVFTFAVSQQLEVALAEEKPQVCDFGDNGMLRFNTMGGLAPYTFELIKDDQTVTSWKSTDGTFPDNKISKLGTANYTLIVTDAVDSKTNASYLLTNPFPIIVDLGADKRFSSEQKEMQLEGAVTSDDENLNYQWTSDNGFTANSPKVTITEPGNYILSVTTEKGCTASDSILVNPSYTSSFILYPNESSDGNYDIQIVLTEPQDFTIQVFDSAGRLISTSKANNKSEYTFHGKRIHAKGVFNVVVFNEKFKMTRKIIVK